MVFHPKTIVNRKQVFIIGSNWLIITRRFHCYWSISLLNHRQFSKGSYTNLYLDIITICTGMKMTDIIPHLPLVRFLLAQTDMVVYNSTHNFNKIMPFSSGIILCSHLFTCFCKGSTEFRSTEYTQVTSAFRSFRSLSSFKMVAPTGH